MSSYRFDSVIPHHNTKESESLMKALILVDLQNDFMPKGALAVKDGAEVVPVANRLSSSMKFDIIVATQDWHPAGHSSFKSTGKDGVWPDHCVWNTKGSEFHKNLLTGRFNLILRKGMDKSVDSYSGFYDNNGAGTGLASYLSERMKKAIENDVAEVYIMGLATDYCVKFTALDCVKAGFNRTFLIEDGCRAVNANDGDGDKAIEEMKGAGIVFVHSDTLTKRSK